MNEKVGTRSKFRYASFRYGATTVSILLLLTWAAGGVTARDSDNPLTKILTEGRSNTLADSGRTSSSSGGNDFYKSAFKNKKGSSGISIRRKPDKPGEWSEENINPVFPELKVLDEVNSRQSVKKLEKAVVLFNMSNGHLRAGQEDIKLKKLKWAGRQYRYAWLKEERRKQQAGVIRRIEARSRNRAIGSLVRAMQLIRGIKNPDIKKSKQFLDVVSKIYVQYVKLQFRSRNLGACVPVLNQYMALRPEHQKDPEPHRLLAAGYRHLESVSKKMNNTRAFLSYKQQKNRHLEQFVLLKYGKTSPQYKEIKKQIDRDRIGVY